MAKTASSKTEKKSVATKSATPKKAAPKKAAPKAKATSVKATSTKPVVKAKAKVPKKVTTVTNRTFTMIKPDAVKSGYIGGILEKINANGFRIVAMKLTKLSKARAKEFYAVHKSRPFYGELVEFMSSGPIVAAVLEKDNAVENFRKLIGSTNPAEAAKGTIRKLYAKSVGENAVHGSDSDENAAIESAFHFAKSELY
ncbi:MAG: nucleoside-diphosphate kinase [Saprospiraceae bacterium]|nr:nucleoside-diphosphate kinase [Saprospiraceae bacterium]MBP7699329.1 nucleoside-diphosphate kinase [Saprospiraceae bacterium]